MKVSVIIPAYNLRNLLPDTVKCALAQSYTDLEVIIVDDGSTDGTAEVADGLALVDDRVKALHIPNGGVGMARRHGVLNATGEWVFFLDGDDMLPTDAIAKLLALDSGTTDLIAGWVDAGSYATMKSLYTGTFTPSEYARQLLLNLTQTGPVAKLIRRGCFNTDLWQHGRDIFQNEDLLMLLSILPAAREVAVTNDVKAYLYNIRPDSVSQSKKMPVSGWLSLFDKIEQLLTLYPTERLPHLANLPDTLDDTFTLYRARRLHKCVIGKRMAFNPSAPELKPIVDRASELLARTELGASDRSLIRTLRSPFRIAVWQSYLGLRRLAKRILKSAR